MLTDRQKVSQVIAIAVKDARIELLRRRNSDEGFTCHTIGISGGCGDNCPVREAGDCEHDEQKD
jgi:hypothetical protein